MLASRVAFRLASPDFELVHSKVSTDYFGSESLKLARNEDKLERKNFDHMLCALVLSSRFLVLQFTLLPLPLSLSSRLLSPIASLLSVSKFLAFYAQWHIRSIINLVRDG